jgi:ATP-dependent Clp protease ATP-binding subunit ClpA
MSLLAEFSPRQELIRLHFSKLLNALLSAKPRSDFQDPEGKYEALKYGIDLTETVKQGKLDPVIG